MKVYIKRYDHINDKAQDISSFTLSEDEFVGYLLSKTGKKLLKSIIPPNSPITIHHPSILGFAKSVYAVCCSLSQDSEKTFYVYDIDGKGDKPISTVFLQKYLPQQLTVNYKLLVETKQK